MSLKVVSGRGGQQTPDALMSGGRCSYFRLPTACAAAAIRTFARTEVSCYWALLDQAQSLRNLHGLLLLSNNPELLLGEIEVALHRALTDAQDHRYFDHGLAVVGPTQDVDLPRRQMWQLKRRESLRRRLLQEAPGGNVGMHREQLQVGLQPSELQDAPRQFLVAVDAHEDALAPPLRAAMRRRRTGSQKVLGPPTDGPYLGSRKTVGPR